MSVQGGRARKHGLFILAKRLASRLENGDESDQIIQPHESVASPDVKGAPIHCLIAGREANKNRFEAYPAVRPRSPKL